MKCFNHEKANAVAQCGNCGISMCKQCYSGFKSFNKVICRDCANKMNNEIKVDEDEIKRNLLWVLGWWTINIIIYIIGGYFGSANHIVNHHLNTSFSYYFAFAYMNVFQVGVWYCIYRSWNQIPSISQHFPIFFGGVFIIMIINIFVFIICATWWIIYTIFIFPIKHFKYLGAQYGSLDWRLYFAKVIAIYLGIIFMWASLLYYNLI